MLAGAHLIRHASTGNHTRYARPSTHREIKYKYTQAPYTQYQNRHAIALDFATKQYENHEQKAVNFAAILYQSRALFPLISPPTCCALPVSAVHSFDASSRDCTLSSPTPLPRIEGSPSFPGLHLSPAYVSTGLRVGSA
eukprot:3932874-Rhodomonas_salina.2